MQDVWGAEHEPRRGERHLVGDIDNDDRISVPVATRPRPTGRRARHAGARSVACGEQHQQVLGVDLVTRSHQHFLDRPPALAVDGALHLHRLD